MAVLVKKNLHFSVQDCVKDQSGRYVIVKGVLHGVTISILNVYYPPAHPSDFITKVFLDFSAIQSDIAIVGGDFNCLLNPVKDRLPSKAMPLSPQAKALGLICEELGYVDVWRALHTADKAYTFFSAPHGCQTRIDYFFLSGLSLHRALSCSIGSILISDHAEVVLELSIKGLNSGVSYWRLNTSVLKDQTFITLFTTEFGYFLTINTQSTDNSALVWETAKAFARGLIISFSASKKRQKSEKQTKLMAELKAKEEAYLSAPSPTIMAEINAIKTTLDNVLTQNEEVKLRFVRQKMYEHGDKPGKYLAYLTKKRVESQSIAALCDAQGNGMYDNKLINNTFKAFYHNLYTSELPNEASVLMDLFFAPLRLPTVAPEDRLILNSPISREEVINAIKLMQNGKAPGPDGFCSEFYKEFLGLLVDPLVSMFNDAFSNNQLPQTLREANISLILKKGKCPESCGSYRPISLLNVDRKILAKILATRLEGLLPKIIKAERRNSSNNVRRLLNIIQVFKRRQIDGLVLSLDAEKAFDRVEWSYLFYCLDKFALGDNFIRWIKVLYNNPQAAILANGIRSDNFPVYRGTRQGCPLSPLLFALVIKPLAEAVRETPSISGLQIDKIDHKISLYADDVLIYIARPETSIPVLLKVIDSFSKFSGYKINFTKSEAMPLGSLNSVPNLLPSFPFKWSPERFTYLGVYITPIFQQMYKTNFVPLFEKVRQDLERWSSLPISWLGRIAMIKMNILPRLLYPIQMIPILFSNGVVKKLNGWLSAFIWRKRKPKLKMATLQMPSSEGGLDLPNFRKYQICAHMRYIYDWFFSNNTSVWLDVETSLSKYPLKDLVFIKSFKIIRSCCDNIITLNTIKAWRLMRRLEGRSKLTSIYTPILNNPDFQPGLLDAGFKLWHNFGIYMLGDLFLNKTLMSFSQLVEKYNIPRQHFFRYLQIRHYILQSTTLTDNSEPSPLEKVLFGTFGRMSIRLLYRALRVLPAIVLQDLRGKWDTELSIAIKDDEWCDIWTYANSISVCNRAKSIQFKILHRMHISPNRRHLFNCTLSPMCLKYKTEVGTLTHCLWSCYKLQRYWSDIVTEMEKTLSVKLEMDPMSLILGLPARFVMLKNQRLYCILTYAARKNILLRWISDKVPSIKGWHKVLSDMVPLEYLTCVIHSKSNQFFKIWEPYLNFLDPSVSDIMLQGFLERS